MTIIVAILAMFFRDGCATLLTIAEARGRPWLAGAFDSAGDLATIVATVAGAGQVITHGWTAHTITILAAIMATSFFGAAFWTKVGSRMGASGHP